MGTIKSSGIVSLRMFSQCKRYTGSVSAGEIRDFRGTMQERTDEGLFITADKSSTPAIEEANRPRATPIDLVDGDELVDKLRELQLGVAPVNDYVTDDIWFLPIWAPDLLVHHLHRQYLSTGQHQTLNHKRYRRVDI